MKSPWKTSLTGEEHSLSFVINCVQPDFISLNSSFKAPGLITVYVGLGVKRDFYPCFIPKNHLHFDFAEILWSSFLGCLSLLPQCEVKKCMKFRNRLGWRIWSHICEVGMWLRGLGGILDKYTVRYIYIFIKPEVTMVWFWWRGPGNSVSITGWSIYRPLLSGVIKPSWEK